MGNMDTSFDLTLCRRLAKGAQTYPAARCLNPVARDTKNNHVLLAGLSDVHTARCLAQIPASRHMANQRRRGGRYWLAFWCQGANSGGRTRYLSSQCDGCSAGEYYHNSKDCKLMHCL